jgi:hypothetical protein
MTLAGIHRFERLFDLIVPAGLLAVGLALVAAVAMVGI